MRSSPSDDDRAGAGAGAAAPASDLAHDLFVTETMAELSARQGRLADAASIYRRLLAGGASDERRARWRQRLAALEGEVVAGAPVEGAGAPAAAAAAAEPRETGAVREREPVAAPPAPAPAPHLLGLPLLIDRPVRSGQVVYAEGRDLIVLAPVNPGAQLLADGHIHVYAPLRGRAVAGVRGCAQAQIFCQRLEAELVGIDAAYVAAEDLPADLQGKPVRIWLDAGACRFARIIASV